jgi:hypothetical protein
MSAGRIGRRAPDAGSASMELLGILPFLLLAALVAWQILLVAFTVTSAENAARAGSRAATRGQDGEEAAIEALSPWLRDDASASLSGTRATVHIEVPILFPGLTNEDVNVSRSAELPSG